MLRLKNVSTLLFTTLITLVLGASAAHAAETSKPKAYFEFRWFPSPILHVDDHQYEAGWFESTYEKAAPAFASNPDAAKHFSQYVSDVKKGQYIAWGTVGTLISFYALDHNRWHLPDHEKNLISSTIAIGGIGSTWYYMLSGISHLTKAINIYNGHETASVAQKQDKQLSFAPLLFANSCKNGAGGGLSMQLDF